MHFKTEYKNGLKQYTISLNTKLNI